MAGQTKILKNFIPKLQIYEPSKDVFDALFINPLYYVWADENISFINHKCALLYLHTLPFQYSKIQTSDIRSFFNNRTERGTETEHGGLEIVPYGFLVFLGGLIWRKRWHDTYRYDPLLLGDDLGLLPYYKPTQSGYDPLLVNIGNSVRFCVIPRDAGPNVTYLKYSDIVNDDMDIYTENALYNLFMEFVKETFIPNIKPLCELKYGKLKPEDSTSTTTIGTSSDTDTGATYPSVQNRNNYIEEHVFDIETISYLRNKLLNENQIGKMLQILTGSVCFKEDDDGTQYFVSNFSPNYSMGFYCSDTDHSYKLYFSENNEIHKYFTELYATNSIAIRTGYNSRSTVSCHRRTTKNEFRSYLNGLCNVLDAKRSHDARNNELVTRTDKTERLSDRDLKCAVYMELKNLWDRWLCGYYNQDRRRYFEVREKGKKTDWQNTLYGNFVFIDSFYNDISYKLKLNCNTLSALGKSDTMYRSDGGTNRVSTHLGNVVSKHKCVMYNFPDYVGFDGNAEHAIDMMENLFKPMPASKVTEPSVMNKFVIIYANGAQMLNSKDRNSFNNDSFNIYSYKDGIKVAPVAFSQKKMFADKGTGQMGYIVPSFCVEYSRQNNSYWTNIGINTSSHANTEVGAMAIANIAEKGNSSKRQICFYGQDVYPIYQAYSYMVTIEMLGNAQIQPLMYFQLLNIPMFTGAYMVINVEHNITPGMMKTTVTGMRMTKVQPPYTKSWFTMADKGKVSPERGGDFVGNGEEIIANENTILDIEDDNLSKAINEILPDATMNCDEFVRAVYGNDRISVNIENNLTPNAEGVDMLKELESKQDEWEVHRFNTKSSPSKQNGWEPLYNSERKHPVCGDLLFGYHDKEVYSSDRQFHHVAIYLGLAAKDSTEPYVAEGVSIGGNMIQVGKDGKVQVCTMKDSRMGLATDVITHWAHCKKYEVKQNTGETPDKFPYRIVPSSVLNNVSDVMIPENTDATATQVVETPVQTQTSEGVSPQYQFSILSIRTPKQEEVSPKQPNPAPQPPFEQTPENEIHEQPNIGKELLYTIEDLEYEGSNEEIRNSLQSLIENVLDPVTRICFEKYGQQDPVMSKHPNVNCGYRSKDRNDKTQGAASNSQHMYGEAADMDYKGTDGNDKNGLRNLKFAKEIISRGIWDKLIIEDPKKFVAGNPNASDIRCGWVHVSYSKRRDIDKKGQRHWIMIYKNHKQLFIATPEGFGGINGLTEWFMRYYRAVVPDGE